MFVVGVVEKFIAGCCREVAKQAFVRSRSRACLGWVNMLMESIVGGESLHALSAGIIAVVGFLVTGKFRCGHMFWLLMSRGIPLMLGVFVDIGL